MDDQEKIKSDKPINHDSEDQSPDTANSEMTNPTPAENNVPCKDPTQINQELNVHFTGTTGEYFRIWIVNIFLSIITLGIYSAWAKVRTRRYFYNHTLLADQNFEYHARPGSILKGHLVIGVFLGFYYLGNLINQWVPFVVMGLFFLFFPFLAYQSLRFRAFNSSWCNIRFKFRGTFKEALWVFMGLPLLSIPTFGLLFPYVAFRMKKYFFHQMSFGNADNQFSGTPGKFYSSYLISLAFSIPLFLVFGLFFGFSVYYSGSMEAFSSGGFNANIIVLFLALYIGVLVTMVYIGQFITARIGNYCWSTCQMEKVTFESHLKAGKLAMIQITNILAIIFSIGMAAPWAKVRRTRYVLSCLKIHLGQNQDDFTTSVVPEVSAIGDAATDIFDLDIGL